MDRVLRQERSRGPATARNAGWRAAAAPLVAFTDDDCRPEPGWLEAGLRAHRAAPGALVQGRTRPEPADEHLLDHPRARSIRVERLGPFFETCNVFYPRRCSSALGGFDETIPTAGSEDTDLALRAFELGARAVFAPEALVNHAVHEFTLPATPCASRSAGARWCGWSSATRRCARCSRGAAASGARRHARLILAPGRAGARRAGTASSCSGACPTSAYRHGWRPGGARAQLRELPGVALVDAAELAVLAAASARHRLVLL